MFVPALTTLIASSAPADLFAAAVEGSAHVFSFAERKKLCEIPLKEAARSRVSAFVTGGERTLLVVGAWREEGVSAWDARTGELVWQRKDLNRTAELAFIGGEPHRPVVGTAREDGLGWALNAVTGKQVAALRTIRGLHAEPALSRFVTVTRTELTLRDGSSWNALAKPPLFKLPGQSLSVLASAISEDLVVISRPGGDFGDGRLEAFTHSGAKRWNFNPAEGSHFISLSPAIDGFVGVESSLRKGPSQLVRIDPDGRLIERRELPHAFAHVPFDHGRYLIASDGRVLDATSLATVWAFGE